VSAAKRQAAKPDFIPLDPRYVLDRLGIMEKKQDDFLELQRKEAEVVARTAMTRDREMLATIAQAVRDAVHEESTGQAVLLDERFGRLSAEVRLIVEPLRSCIDEEERRRELLEAEVHQNPDREEFERLVKKGDADRHDAEVALDRVVARIEGEIDAEIRGENGIVPRQDKLEERLRAVEIAPAKQIIAAAGLIAGTAVALEWRPIVDGIKHFFSGGKS
jgi:hypothetical protein